MIGRLVVRFGGAVVSVEHEGRRAERVARFLFGRVSRAGPIRRARPPDPAALRLVDEGAGLVLTMGDRVLASGADLGAVAEILLGEVCRALAGRIVAGLALHAACVLGAGGAWLLPGVSGAGKSTLTAWLVRGGFSYATDELTFVRSRQRAGPLDARGFSRPLHLKRAADGTFAGLAGVAEVDDDRWTRFERGCLVDPERLRGGAAVGPARAPVAVVVIPRFVAGSSAELGRLRPAETAARLMESLANARSMGRRGLAQAARLARGVPAWSLRYGALDQLPGPIAEIERTLTAGRPPRSA